MNDEREAATAEAATRLERLTTSGTILTEREAEDLRMVLHGLRIYRFERDGERQMVERISANSDRREADNKTTLRRVRSLVNHKRKTLAMADLLAALDPRESAEEPTR